MSSDLVLPNPRFEDFTVELSDRDPPYIEKLREKISGEVFEQDRAIRKVLQRIALIDSGKQKRPSPLFFAGPPGSGKSYLAEVAAYAWLGKPRGAEDGPLVSIAGENFRESHTISALLGAPAGYIGHGGSGSAATKSPLEKLGTFDMYRNDYLLDEIGEKWVNSEMSEYTGNSPNEYRESLEDLKEMFIERKLLDIEESKTSMPYRSVLRVDEFEKMHEEVQKQFLTILNDGFLQLRSNRARVIDFRGCLIIFTSNIGTGEISKFIDQKPIGFHSLKKDKRSVEDMDQRIYETVKRAVEKNLPPELYSRIGHDGLVVFHKLSARGFENIVEKEINEVREEFREDFLFVHVTQEFKDFILEEADSSVEGARMMSRLIDKYMRLPLAKRINSGDFMAGDVVLVTVVDKEVKLKMMPRLDGMELHTLSGGHKEVDEKSLEKEFFSDIGDVYRMILEDEARQRIKRKIPKPSSDDNSDDDIDDLDDDSDIYDHDDDSDEEE
ncbi:MAG: AAA family ATPase [Candidatus Spechtbacterales bacterium]